MPLLHLTAPPIIGTTPLAASALFRAPDFLPRALSAFFFETHYLYYIVLALLTAALFYTGRKIGRRIAWAVLALLLLWVVAALAFDTPAERLRHAHQAILDASVKPDAAALCAWLAPDFRAGDLDRNAMTRAIADTLKMFPPKSHRVTHYSATILTPPSLPPLPPPASPPGPTRLARTEITLLTTLDPASAAPGNYLTAWTLMWTDDPAGDWQLQAITRFALNNTDLPLSFPPKGP